MILKIVSTQFLFLLLLLSCEQKDLYTRSIQIDLPNNPNCYFFIENESDTLHFKRNIKIVVNNLTDTIKIGQGIIAPKYVGNYAYTKLGNRNDIALDLNYSNPSADRICVSSYKDKSSIGELTIELILYKD